MVMPAQMQNAHDRERTAKQRPRVGERCHETPIDWAHLSRFTMNDRALEQEVLGLFAIEAPRYLAQLNAAADRKDWIEAAHTLKGSARAVGAWAIAECAQAAEALQLSAPHEFVGNRARGGSTRTADGTPQVLERLGDAVYRTLAYIEQMRSQTAVAETCAHSA
jgi:HPt (histidine-containing phosphotransfer) domain-containing protein